MLRSSRSLHLRSSHAKRCKEDLQTEAVVELFRRAWQKQQQVASFCDDEHADTIGVVGEELVRIYMRRAAPPIQPAAIEQRTMRGYSRPFATRRSSISSTRKG
jgi:hypothetical protein